MILRVVLSAQDAVLRVITHVYIFIGAAGDVAFYPNTPFLLRTFVTVFGVPTLGEGQL